MLSALDLLVRQGKVRYLGAVHHAWRFAQSLSLSERNGWARFVSMQDHYNLIYREEEREMLPLCRAEGIAVIPWSPLARGSARHRRARDSTAAARAASDQLRLGPLQSAGRDRRDAGVPAGGGPAAASSPPRSPWPGCSRTPPSPPPSSAPRSSNTSTRPSRPWN